MPNNSQQTGSFDHEAQNYSNYDLFIFALTIFSLFILALLIIPGINEAVKNVAFVLDTVICFFFLGDFFRSLHQAPDKRAYLKWGWIDFLGSLPALPIFRIFRVARLVRIWRIMHRLGFKEVWHIYKERRSESALWTTILATIILLSASSVLIVEVEETSPDTAFVDVGDGMWWSFVTVTTVGYGDKVPTTGTGRLIATVLMTLGVALVSVLTSSITSALFLHGSKEQQEDVKLIRDQLDRIEELLQQVESDQLTASQNQE
jgi:voltage-gated potassium channel